MKALLTARPISIGAAWIGAAFSALVLVFGYAAFGLWTTLIFASGFLGGFVLWIVFGNARSAKAIRLPYWICLGLFVMHRIEERISGFFGHRIAPGHRAGHPVDWTVAARPAGDPSLPGDRELPRLDFLRGDGCDGALPRRLPPDRWSERSLFPGVGERRHPRPHGLVGHDAHGASAIRERPCCEPRRLE